MPDREAADLLDCLKSMFRLVKLEGEESAREAYIKLNFSDATVLDLVNEQPGVSMGDVSRELGSPLSTATTVVDRLVRKGLVDRGRDEKNRRVIRLHPTENGVAFYRTKRTHEEDVCRLFLEMLPDSARETYLELSKKIAEGSDRRLDFR